MGALATLQAAVLDIAHLVRVATRQHLGHQAVVIRRLITRMGALKRVPVLGKDLLEDTPVPRGLWHHRGAPSWGDELLTVQRLYHASSASSTPHRPVLGQPSLASFVLESRGLPGSGKCKILCYEQKACYSGKKKDHTVKNVLLVNALLLILFLSDTYGGRVHDKRIADATPYPLPARSRLLQALGFLAFTLPQVEILMSTKKQCGEDLTLAQQRANQVLHQRRLRIEHVNSSLKRCRSVKDRLRLWKQGIRDLVMEIRCALHNFRVRLTPWQPMV